MIKNSAITDASSKPSAPEGWVLPRWLRPLQTASLWRLAVFYLGLLTVAEALTTLVEARIGMVIHAFILFLLLFNAVLRQGPQAAFLLTLALAPLIRLTSLSLPLPSFPFVYWYAIVGGPLILATMFAIRAGHLSYSDMGLNLKKPGLQVLIALTGIGLGALEYIILRPEPLVNEFTPAKLILPALILLIFTGFLEELIFRGAMQFTSINNFGFIGLVYISTVFAVLHIGYRSILDVLFVFAVAMFFAVMALLSKSIVGVTLAHGLTNIGLFLVFPFVIGAKAVSPITPPPVIVDNSKVEIVPYGDNQPAFPTTSPSLTPSLTWTTTPTATFTANDSVSAAAIIPTRTATFTPTKIFTPTSTPTIKNTALQPTATAVVAGAPLFSTKAMILIAAGKFTMGCDPDNPVVFCEGDQGPLRAVTLNAFLIDRDEVTNAAYLACVTAGVCIQPVTEDSPLERDYFSNPGYANFPVVNVSWGAAQTYCTWLGKRLPSEAEWEKAARGVDDTRPYPWGRKEASCWRGNFISPRGSCYIGPLEIGSHGLQGASPYGVLDLSGNVAEWVADWYEQTYYTRSPEANPPGPDSGDLKVVRGGSWNEMWFRAHLAYRDAQLPIFTSPEIGFRCAATPP